MFMSFYLEIVAYKTISLVIQKPLWVQKQEKQNENLVYEKKTLAKVLKTWKNTQNNDQERLGTSIIR